jgi:thioredoxin-related protein
VVFEARPAAQYEASHELRKLSTFGYTPNFVFLDAGGRKVFERRGFSTPREARAIHEFVTKRHYRTRKFEDFLAAYPAS